MVRLEGTNAHIARKMLAESGLETLFTESMEEAAKRVLEATERNTS